MEKMLGVITAIIFPKTRIFRVKEQKSWALVLMSVIPATWEAEIRRIAVQSQLGKIVRETLSQKQPSQKKGWWSGSRYRPCVQSPVPHTHKRRQNKLPVEYKSPNLYNRYIPWCPRTCRPSKTKGLGVAVHSDHCKGIR
jgi:hypothetical protein